ncbi:Ig-like domain repeat protein [Streptomyces kronopolitis]|uniref:Ig-like domain repeat protein n=1 Tax=Streptomyces kronopolitis TaxID=1612435 RepID=UPI0034222034
MDTTGQACFTSTTLTSGTITATYAGNTCTSASVNSVGVTVQPASTCLISLVPPSGTVTAGQATTLTATVTCNGLGVSNATVAFTSNGAPLGSATTNTFGVATGAVTFTTPGTNTITATVTAAGTACTCTNVTSAPVTVTVQPPGGTFRALPACYALAFPPLPWSFALATLTATGATPGATIAFRSGAANGPVLCTAVADSSGNASCTTNLSVFQLALGYTATTPTTGGLLTSTNTLSPCL